MKMHSSQNDTIIYDCFKKTTNNKIMLIVNIFFLFVATKVRNVFPWNWFETNPCQNPRCYNNNTTRTRSQQDDIRDYKENTRANFLHANKCSCTVNSCLKNLNVYILYCRLIYKILVLFFVSVCMWNAIS